MPDYSTLPGMSGYGINPSTGTYGLLTGTAAKSPAASDPLDYGVYDPASGRVVSIKTGRPWQGQEPRTGTVYNNGIQPVAPPGKQFIPGTTTPIDPNDPNQRYKPVDITKAPDISAETGDLLTAFKTSAANTLKGFDDYVKQFQGEVGQAVKQSNAASNIAPTTAALTASQQQYSDALSKSAQQLADENARATAAEQGIVSQANAILPQYDTAAQNIGDRMTQELEKQISRYKMAGGTPTSLGGDEESLLLRGVADIQLPLEQQKIQRQYDLLNNLALPVQRDITGRNISQITQFDPYAASQQYGSFAGTSGQIQQLKTAAAAQDWQTATSIMQAMGLPADIQNRILSGDTSVLGQLAQLEEASRYRGLQDILGTNLSQPVGYNFATPTLPGGRYSTITGNTSLGPNAPITTGTSPMGPAPTPTANDFAYQQQTGYFPWQDPNFSSAAYRGLGNTLEDLGSSRYPVSIGNDIGVGLPNYSTGE